MKKLLSVLVLLLMVVLATAQNPKINYQAVVRDSHNHLVASTTIQVDVTVTYNGGTYTENLSGTTNANGLLSLEIGGGNNFDAIDWSTATIQTTAHLPGNEIVEDVVNVTAVPFALYANHAVDVSINSPTVMAIYNDMQSLSNRIIADSLALIDGLNSVNTEIAGLAYSVDTAKASIRNEISNLSNDIATNYATKAEVAANVDSVKGNLRNEIATKANTSYVNDQLALKANSADLANVATSGSYNDLTDIPTIPAQVNADWTATSGAAQILNKPTLANVATSGSYNDLTDIPTIPAQVNADWTATSGAAEILNKPTIPTVPTNVSAFTNDANYVSNATCDSLDFCALMGKVNNLVNTVSGLNGDISDMQNAVQDLTNTVAAMQYTIDSLGEVIDGLSAVVPRLSLFASPMQVAISHVNNVDVASVTCNAILTNADGYTIHWKVDGNDSTSTNSSLTVNFMVAGTHKVLSMATKDGFPTLKDSVTITVTKGTPTMTAPTANELTYTGELQNLVTGGSTTGGTLKYKLDNGEYSTDIPQATNAGNYTVYYKVEGNDSWNDVNEASLAVSITKAALTSLSVTIDGWTSGQSANSPSVTGNTGNGQVTYNYKSQGADDNTYTTDVPTAAGDYTVRASVAETDNYLAGTATADFTIAAAASGVPDGAINGKFTVNADGDKVYFSQGNLQAKCTTADNNASTQETWTWQFATNQWDYIGNDIANTSINGNGSVSTAGIVDLFGWVGQSNITWTGAAQYGISNSTTTESTATYGNNANEALKSDWGKLAITNGGNTENSGWRTLTSEEWAYLFDTRASGSTVNGTNNARYTHATINTDGTAVNGMILFPDGVDIANNEATSWGAVNQVSSENTWDNKTKCTSAQWTALAAKGCVFLPAAGYREGSSVNSNGNVGYYWSSSSNVIVKNAYCMFFRNKYLYPSFNYERHKGISVRLVKEATSSGDDPTPTSWNGDFSNIPTSALTNGNTVVVPDGTTLTGTLSQNYKIMIANGATVTLDNVTINGEDDSDYEWAGITCEGDATIILKDGTTNTVKGFYQNYPGIHVPSGSTLTIQGESAGTGSLTASPNSVAGYGAGIGGGMNIACGNINIQGGTVTATGGSRAAGIGSGYGSGCGNINISGGTITANGGEAAAGIGSGNDASCGDITITADVTSVTATKGGGAPNSIGAGEDGTCGTVTIGGTVYTNGISESPYTYPTPVSSITLNKTTTTITVGTSETLSVTSVLPGNATDQTVTWSSNATGVATVNATTGEVTAVAVGTATITATANGGSNVTATCVVTVEAAQNVVNLSTLTGNYEAQDGDVLSGTLGGNYKITIADGATVTLDNLTINGVSSGSYSFAGLTCLGDATIILKDGTTNTVKGFEGGRPGIQAAPGNKTLTITGGGSLDASSNGYAPGIGSAYWLENACGNIVIEGGTIVAIGGDGAAGIGSATSSACGDINITGGTITANGGERAAGIGSGREASCGNITITTGVTLVTATKGEYAPNSIGRGDNGTFGTVTIGGVLTGGITTSPYTYDPTGPAPTPAPITTTVTWDNSNCEGIYVTSSQSATIDGVQLSCNYFMNSVRWKSGGIIFEVMGPDGFTFTAPSGKKFTKIEIQTEGMPSGWDIAADDNILGTGWPSDMNQIYMNNGKITWEGNATSVGLLTNANNFNGAAVSSIVFTLADE